MFITELANIYSKKPYLSEIIPFHEISPQLDFFLNQEVRLGTRNLNPYRFSFQFAYQPKDVINLFIAFSTNDGPLERLYRYDCDDCGETNILNDEQLKNFNCYECGSTGSLETKEFLENVKVIFEIKEPYLKDVKKRLKDQASSETIKAKYKSEEANTANVTLKDIITANVLGAQVIDSNLLDIEQRLMNKMSFGLNS